MGLAAECTIFKIKKVTYEGKKFYLDQADMITLIGNADAQEMKETFLKKLNPGDLSTNIYSSEYTVEVIQDGYKPWSGKISAWCFGKYGVLVDYVTNKETLGPLCYGIRTDGPSKGQFKVGDTVKPKVCSEIGIFYKHS